MQAVGDLADFPPDPAVCPQCGGGKRKTRQVCAKCEAQNKLNARMKAGSQNDTAAAVRSMYFEQPPAAPVDDDVLPTVADVVQEVQTRTQDTGKKITGWDEDDLDLVVYLLAVAVFIGVGWATMSAIGERDYAPQFGECSALCKPLARIVARRVKVPGMKSGDFKDALGIASALAAYGMRCYNVAQLRHEQNDEARARAARPVNQQVTEAVTPEPVAWGGTATTAFNPENVPPPNGTHAVATGRAAIPPQVRRTLEGEGKL